MMYGEFYNQLYILDAQSTLVPIYRTLETSLGRTVGAASNREPSALTK